MNLCRTCQHEELRHLPGNGPCLATGCLCDKCIPFEYKGMFAVRIDKTAEGYAFKVEPMEPCAELIALDSAPGVIAFVEAPDPGTACKLAWERGQRELASLGGLPPSPVGKLLELLGDKK